MPLMAKRRSNPAVAIRRAAISDGWLPKMRQAMRRELAAHVKEAAKAVGEGRQKWAAELAPKWAKSLAAVKLPLMLAMTMDGYHLAEVEFGKGAAIREMMAKDEIILDAEPPTPPISIGELETAFGHEAYLAQRLHTPVGDWVAMTSKWETETSAREIERIVRRGAAEGLTPRDMQKQLLSQGLARSKTRAELITRTTTIWSYNEGAKQLYADEGVGTVSWLVTDDDALCLDGYSRVLSADGTVAIKDIEPGDLVCTPEGLRRVMAKSQRATDGPLSLVCCENGMLLCTANHRIYEKSRGWVKAGNLKTGDVIQNPDNKGDHVVTVVDLVFGNPNDRPSPLLKIARFAGVAAHILVPIFTIYLQRNLAFWKRKINRVTSDLTFLIKRNVRSLQGFADNLFDSSFALIASVTGNRTKSAITRGLPPKLLAACEAGKKVGGPITCFGTILPLWSVGNKRFTTADTDLSSPNMCPALPTTNGISLGNAGVDSKSLATNGADLQYLVGCASQITGTRTEASSPIGGGCRYDKFRAAYLASQSRSFLRRGMITASTTICVCTNWMRRALKCLAAILTGKMIHGSILLTGLRALYHLWQGKATVFDIKVEDAACFYANGILVHNCDYCSAFDGMEIPINDRFVAAGTRLEGETEVDGYTELTGGHMDIPFDVEHPPLHPNCVAGETAILAPGKLAGFVAPYNGPVIELGFADSGRLTVTPNHMLLTPWGFAKAKSLREGDQVIYCPSFERIIGSHPNNNGHPTRIDDVVKALAASKGMTTGRVPMTPEYFHGDGTFLNGKVNVIATDSFLRSHGQTPTRKSNGETGFSGSYAELLPLPGERDFATMLLRLGAVADSIMGGRREAEAFSRRELLHSDFVGVASTSRSDISSKKSAANGCSGNVKRAGKRQFRFPGDIAPDNIARVQEQYSLIGLDGISVKDSKHSRKVDAREFRELLSGYAGEILPTNVTFTRRRNFRGHVYDLQTIPSLYIANGVVSSNCRCTLLASI